MAEGLVQQPQQQLVSLAKGPRHYNHTEDVEVIMDEILSRLPVKSLLQFRRVCKSWRALISDSYFVKKHLAHTVTNTSNRFRFLLLRPFISCPRIVDLRELKDHDSTHQHYFFWSDTHQHYTIAEDTFDRSKVLGSCNSLICLQETIINGIYRKDIFIWNPSTRVSKRVSKHNTTKSSAKFHGFGYDSTTEDYKLILEDSSSVAEGTKIGIFSLKTSSWRTVEDTKFVNVMGQGCFVNGALHWLEYYEDKGNSTSIISFDLAEKSEKLCRIVYGTMFRIEFGIGSIGNRLCYYTYSIIRSMPITIWVMNEYGVDKPWTKLMNVPTDIIPYKMFLEPKHILENGEVLMILEKMEFVIYNPKENKYRTVLRTKGISPSTTVAVYLDTLVSPEFSS